MVLLCVGYVGSAVVLGFRDLDKSTQKPKIEPRQIRRSTKIDSAIVSLVLPDRIDAKLVNEIEKVLCHHGAKLRRAKQDDDLAKLLKQGCVLAIGHAWNNRIVRRLCFEMYDWTNAP